MKAAVQHATNGDVRIAYETRGAGEPLLLMHGLGYGRWGWEPLLDSLADDFRVLDLRRWESCLEATRGMDHVYHLAANMGGIGFIETNKAVIVHDNTLINTHMLEAARRAVELAA
jgi:nucleoside-diphosphate-sugar epimerase